MQVEQYVTAYRIDPEQVKPLLPQGFTLLRPVLRFNVEIIRHPEKGTYVRIEHNTPVEARGKRGWRNLSLWESPEISITTAAEDTHLGEPTPGAPGVTKGRTTVFRTPFLTIAFTGVGLEGGCPAEGDNDGCFYERDGVTTFVPAEKIDANKEYCDCEFQWHDALTPAMSIPMEEILGAYKVSFQREVSDEK